MKFLILFLFACLTVCWSVRADPILVISTRSLESMITASTKIAEAFEPGSSKNSKGGLFGELGRATDGVDPKRPWHYAIFQRNNEMSFFGTWSVYYVPVSNYAAFAKALPENGAFRRHSVQKVGDHAVVVQKMSLRSKPPAQEDISRFVEWAKKAPRKVEHDFTVVFELNANLRNIGVLGMTLARQALAEQMKPSDKQQRVRSALLLPGAYEMLSLHLDLATAIVKGTERVTITLDVEEDRLLLRDRMEALPDSDYARLLKPSKSDLGSLIKRFDADLPVVVAAHIEGDSQLRKSVLSAVRAGTKLNAKEDDAQFASEAEGLLTAMLPVSVAMTVDWRRKYQATGVYQFAKREAGAIRQRLLEFIPRYLTVRANTDQVYSKVKLRKNARQIDGFEVDQLRTQLNRESSLFADDDVKEVLKHFWPEDEITVEYAAQGSRLFFASGTPVEKAVRPAANPVQSAVEANSNTVMLVRFNPVELVIQTLISEQRPSLNTLKLLERLDADGAFIDAKIDLDGGMNGTASIPFRVIREFGKLVNGQKN